MSFHARLQRTIPGVVALLVVSMSNSAAGRRAAASPSPDPVVQGAALFVRDFTVADGLGPLFNRTSCVSCHAEPIGGMGPNGLATALRVGRLVPGGKFDALNGEGGPVARSRIVDDATCGFAPGIPATANVTSVRNTPDLRGAGLIDAISDDTIRAGAVPRGDGVHGRAHHVDGADRRQRIGRFGWKADTATLTEFVADAFRNELGITSPLAKVDLAPPRSDCAEMLRGVEIDRAALDAVRAFIASLPPPPLPPPPPRSEARDGMSVFQAIGCTSCHTPTLPAGDRSAALFSDLLLHDMGPELDDKFVQGEAEGRDWRTTPLWGVGTRPRLLHDGRARTLSEAILAHGGEAAPARERFRGLGVEDRDRLLAFLRTL